MSDAIEKAKAELAKCLPGWSFMAADAISDLIAAHLAARPEPVKGDEFFEAVVDYVDEFNKKHVTEYTFRHGIETIVSIEKKRRARR